MAKAITYPRYTTWLSQRLQRDRMLETGSFVFLKHLKRVVRVRFLLTVNSKGKFVFETVVAHKARSLWSHDSS